MQNTSLCKTTQLEKDNYTYTERESRQTGKELTDGHPPLQTLSMSLYSSQPRVYLLQPIVFITLLEIDKS